MYKRIAIIPLLAALLLALAGTTVFGAVPQKINYQGYLTNSSSVPVNGTVDMVFAIYNVSSGGEPLWTETQAAVTVSQGIYSVVLGSGTPINLPFDTAYYLGITVGADSEMTPRQPLTSVGYAFKAETANAATTATDFSGSLTGDVTGTQGATVVSLVGGQTSANVATGAALANNATSANTASQIVRRDASGNFSAGTITANVTGNVSGTAANVTGTVAVGNGGTGTTTGSITGTGALTFTAGGANTNVNLVPNGTGSVDVASKRITSVATPTGGTDAANKSYVDTAVSGGGVSGLSKVVHGCVLSTGVIQSGSGFTVSHPTTGKYVISFTSAFSSAPTVIASTREWVYDATYAYYYFVGWDAPSTTGVIIYSSDPGSVWADVNFCFMAMN